MLPKSAYGSWQPLKESKLDPQITQIHADFWTVVDDSFLTQQVIKFSFTIHRLILVNLRTTVFNQSEIYGLSCGMKFSTRTLTVVMMKAIASPPKPSKNSYSEGW